MAWLHTLTSRFLGLFGKQRRDDELDDELRFHLEMETEENIRKGMSPEEAKREARLRLGGVEQVKEEYREHRGLPFLESLAQDVRFALRSFRRDLGFTATVLVTLALGIGVGTAIFSVVNAVLLQPLPYKEPDRLVYLKRSRVEGGIKSQSNPFKGVSYGDCAEWRSHSGLFESVACVNASVAVLERGYSYGDVVDENFCNTLGVQPLLGRCFAGEDFRARSREWPTPIMLLYPFWQSQFGGDPEIVGKTTDVGTGGYSAIVVGVMPPDFVFHYRSLMWLTPFPPFRADYNPHRYFGMNAIARLKPGITLKEAQAGAEVFSQRMAELHPDTHQGWQYSLSPVAEEAAGGLDGPLRLLLAGVGLMLLIVCLNVAGLVGVRSLGRSSEIAVRSAIGAGRRRLVRQLLTESLLLSLFGGVLALAVAWPLVQYLRLWIPSTKWADALLQPELVRIDPWVLAFAAGAALGSGVLFGLTPALRGTSIHLANYINEGGGKAVSRSGGQRARDWLSVAQVALAVLLTVGSGLLLRSFLKLHQQGAGFQPRNVIALPVELGASKPKSSVEQGLIYERLREELEGIPGVEAVALGGGHRLTGGDTSASYLTSKAGAAAIAHSAFRESADTRLFQLLGIPLIAGRSFDTGDRADSPPVAIVSQEAAKQFWPGQDPVGKKLFRERDGKAEEPGMTIVGVVGDVREDGLGVDPHPVVYQPTTQWRGWTFLFKTARDPNPLYPEIIARMRAVFPDTIPFPVHYERLDHLMRDSTWQLNYAALILSVLAGLALLVSAVGVYGVLSYTVRQRTREIGLRLALGAERPQVLKVVLRHGLSIGAAGVVLGLVAAAGLTRFLGSLLYGVEPLDVSTFAGVAVVLLAAALLASYIPARRAASVDPMAALRHE